MAVLYKQNKQLIWNCSLGITKVLNDEFRWMYNDIF